jgi:hypothetical protein
MMNVSVVIVSWNAGRYLKECLVSLRETTAPNSPEVIVVDNASTDGSPEMVESLFQDVKLVRCRENLGFAKANNIGIRLSQAPYIALVNSDVRLFDGCLDGLVEFLERHPEAGLVGPKILNTDLTVQTSCRRFPSLWNNFCSASGLARSLGRHRFFSGEQMFDFRHDQVRSVDVLAGCFWMFRREAWEAVGSLDEEFFIYAEDLDWCKRCWDAGWQVVFFPEAQAIHHRGGSSANDPVRFAVEQHRALLHYWQKHHGLCGRLGILAILLGGQLLRYCAAVTSGLTRRLPESDSRLRMRTAAACLRTLLTEGVAP